MTFFILGNRSTFNLESYSVISQNIKIVNRFNKTVNNKIIKIKIKTVALSMQVSTNEL